MLLSYFRILIELVVDTETGKSVNYYTYLGFEYFFVCINENATKQNFFWFVTTLLPA